MCVIEKGVIPKVTHSVSPGPEFFYIVSEYGALSIIQTPGSVYGGIQIGYDIV